MNLVWGPTVGNWTILIGSLSGQFTFVLKNSLCKWSKKSDDSDHLQNNYNTGPSSLQEIVILDLPLCKGPTNPDHLQNDCHIRPSSLQGASMIRIICKRLSYRTVLFAIQFQFEKSESFAIKVLFAGGQNKRICVVDNSTARKSAADHWSRYQLRDSHTFTESAHDRHHM